jgi:hypothetical protein
MFETDASLRHRSVTSVIICRANPHGIEVCSPIPHASPDGCQSYAAVSACKRPAVDLPESSVIKHVVVELVQFALPDPDHRTS